MTTKTDAPHRIWHVPQMPMKAFYFEVPDLATARILVEAFALYDLFQYENRVKGDYANASGIQVWEDDEWVDVDEDEL